MGMPTSYFWLTFTYNYNRDFMSPHLVTAPLESVSPAHRDVLRAWVEPKPLRGSLMASGRALLNVAAAPPPCGRAVTRRPPMAPHDCRPPSRCSGVRPCVRGEG